MNLIFLPARQGDAKTIYALAEALIREYEDPGEIDIPAALAWTERKILTHLSEYTRVVRNGQTVGFFRLHTDETGTELDDLYVLAPFRRSGIGTEILKVDSFLNHQIDVQLLDEIGEKSPVCLYVFRQNTCALALYQKMGFCVTELIGSTRYRMQRNG